MKIERLIPVAFLTVILVLGLLASCNTSKTETATTTAPEKAPAKTSTTKKSTTKKSTTETTKKEATKKESTDTTARHPINSGTKGGPPSELATSPSPSPEE
jgi:hypothetical protein